MFSKEFNGLKYYCFESFTEAGIKHGFFTRLGGVSPEPWKSLNTATTRGDSAENVVANLKLMFGALGLDYLSRYDGHQCHSTTVICADKPRDLKDSPLPADGLLTDKPEVTLLQRFGDCVPVLLYDPVRKVVGVYHAGWPGTVDNMCAYTIRTMMERYGTNPTDLLAGIGPSIGPDHFVVQEDVASKFRETFGERFAEISEPREDGIYIDLWRANQMRLEDMGVKQIETAEICTVCHKDEWFSHRGDHGATGRFGVLITLG